MLPFFEFIPPNPNTEQPGRRETVRTRLLSAALGSIIFSSSVIALDHVGPANSWYELGIAGLGIGAAAVLSAGIAELQERFGGFGDEGEDGDWPPDDGPDDEPPEVPPDPPGGLQRDWTHEVEDFLSSRQPAGVA